MFLLIASTVVAVFMGITMTVVRLKAAERPTSVKRTILPPIFMSTGALMFLFPPFQIKWIQVIEALSVGVLFSIFLIVTSKFEIRNGKIYLNPSKSFIFILFGPLFIRMIFKLIIGSKISFTETSGMFFLLGFGMIGTWRLAMLYQFKQLEKKLVQYESK